MTQHFDTDIDKKSKYFLDAEKRAHVQKWLSDNSGRITFTSVGAAILALPVMAVAQAATGTTVQVTSIPGVTGVEQLGNGSLLVRTESGVSVNVAAADVTLVNGEFVISQAAANVVAEVAAQAIGAGLGAGGLAAAGAGFAAVAGSLGGGDDTPALPFLNGGDVLGTSFFSSGAGGAFEAVDTSASSVVVTINGVDYTATIISPATGDWELDNPIPAADLAAAQGEQEITVQALDSSGDPVGTPQTTTVVIDTEAPTTPTVALTTDSGTDGDGITNDVALTISAADAGVTRVVKVTDGTGAEVSSGATYTAPTADGQYTVTITDTDAAGNAAVGVASFTLDTTDPATPVITLDTDSGSSATDGITNDGTITITAAEANATRDITVNGTSVGATYAGPTTDGDYTIVVTDTDVAGNTSSETLNVTVDTAPEAAPTVALVNDTGSSDSDTITSDGALTTVTPPTGGSVSYVINGGPASATYDVTALTEGANSVAVTVTDAAGNESAATTVDFTLDTTAPTAPTVALTNDTGTSATDNISSDAALTISPLAAGDTRVTTITDASGARVPAITTDGTYTVTVTDTDAAGNSTTSAPLTFIYDTTAPAPTVALTTDTGSSDSDAITNDAALTFSALEIGATREITLNGASQGGTYTAPSVDGNYTVTVVDTDIAGNANTAVSTMFTLDSQASLGLQVAGVSNGTINLLDESGTSVTGTASDVQDGATVTVTFNGTEYTGTVTSGAFTVAIPAAEITALNDTGTGGSGIGNISVSATVTDLAGNVANAPAVTVPYNFNGPSIGINAVAGDDLINAVESGADVTISGTSSNIETGQPVTLVVNGVTIPGVTIGAGGVWTVDVTPSAANGLTASGAVNITADASDTQTQAAPQATKTVTVDLDAPTIAITTPIATDDIVNAAEQGAGFTIAGTATGADGQTATITVGGTAYTADVAAGAWSLALTPAQAGMIADAATVAITADVSDPAGNPATQASTNIAVDTAPPTVTITAPTSGSTLIIADAAADGTIDGTAVGAPDGATVTVLIKDAGGTTLETLTGSVNAEAFAVVVTAAQQQALTDGTYTLEASAPDAAGNVGTSAVVSITTDFTPPTLTVDSPVAGDNTVDVRELADGGLVITGTMGLDAEGLNVSVSDGMGGTVSASSGLSVPNGATVATFDATFTAQQVADNFANGTPTTITVAIRDTNNNPASQTIDVTYDATPVLTLNDLGDNGVIQGSGFDVSGEAFGLAEGAPINVDVNGTVIMGFVTGNTWEAFVSDADIQALNLNVGDTLNISVQDGGMAVTPIVDSIPLVAAPEYVMGAIDVSATSITLGLFLFPETTLDSNFGTNIEYNATASDFDEAESLVGGNFFAFELNATSVSLSLGNGTVVNPTTPFITATFDITDPNAALSFEGTNQSAVQDVFFYQGTAGADVITAADLTDSFGLVVGGAGDDTIDLGGANFKVVVFQADQASNGSDTIANFEIGAGITNPDAIMFNLSTAETAALRGAGTGIEELAEGALLGTDTGFVIFSTAVADLAMGTLADAAETLTGTANGDAFFILAADGTDAALARIEFSGTEATAELMGTFTGVTDAAAFETDGILFPDLSAALMQPG